MVINGRISAVGKSISGNISSNGTVNGSVDKADSIYVKELYFNNRFEFPNIGKNNMLYIAKDEHRTYMFNSEILNYEIVGTDYTEIEIIQGIL